MTDFTDDDEFQRVMLASGKKGKGKKKATFSLGASSPPKKAKSVPKAEEKGKAAAAQDTGPRFYEADSLKIPLFDNGGKKRVARATKTIAKKSVDELFDIVEQYAGADEKEKLKNKDFSKADSSVGLKRKRHSHLRTIRTRRQDEAEQVDVRPPTFAPSASSTTKKVKKPTVEGSVASTKDAKSQIAVKEDSTRNHPVDKKRRASDQPADGQPHQKHRKHDHQANLQTTSTGPSAKNNPIGKQDYDSIPALPQTVKQTTAYKSNDDYITNRNRFMGDINMHPADENRSSVVVRGRDEDYVLTAGSSTEGGSMYLHEITVPHTHVQSAVSHIAPFLKEGKHGPGGDFDSDRDRMTGRGHDYHPNDAKLNEEYLANRRAFWDMHPTYPQLKEGEVVDPEVKADRDMWEEWYFGFRERYPGSRGDQWVCGCQKWTEESEDESEEE